jgi:hypothetical protein
LPSPSLSADSFGAIDDTADRRQYAYHHMYHTELVGGLLCAALLDTAALDAGPVTSPAPTGHWPSAQQERSCLQTALAALRDNVGRVFDLDESAALEVVRAVRWAGDDSRFHELCRRWAQVDSDPAVVRRMAYDATVVESARDYDLAGLATTLRAAVRDGPLTPTVVAGAGFLARQVRANGRLHTARDGVPDRDAAATTAAIAASLDAVDRRWSTAAGSSTAAATAVPVARVRGGDPHACAAAESVAF